MEVVEESPIANTTLWKKTKEKIGFTVHTNEELTEA